MATIQAQTNPDVSQLLKAVENLSDAELDQFVSEALALRAKRCVPHLPQREKELLKKIDRWMPAEIEKRYDELTSKRQAEMLTPDEYDELLKLTDHVETLETQRLEYLVELANLRKLSLKDLMKDLEIGNPSHG